MRIARSTLAAAYLLDWLAGDPEWLPHPVRLIGRAIDTGERALRRPGQSPAFELLTGAALTVGLTSAVYCATAQIITHANRRARWLGITTETLLAWTCLASRNLHDEATAVVSALDTQPIAVARKQLARIVGRDTLSLDQQNISRAVIETVAESASDGVIAPLFYLAVGGVPLAMAYKTINTLDSMIGHADHRYVYFGKAAARLDDVANLLPARLTALAIVVAAAALPGPSPALALSTWLRDGDKHKSPNAGQPESAMAGALQVQLGGENFYDGVELTTPLLGRGFPAPSVRTAKHAIHIAAAVSALGFAAALLSRGRRP